jgi:hypothetical protein
MKIKEFLNVIKEELMDTPHEIITESCEFRKLDEWNSLFIMIVKSRLDDDFKVNLSEDKIKEANTLGELFLSIQKK